MISTPRTIHWLIALSICAAPDATTLHATPDGERSLVYSTYLGGSQLDRAQAVALDRAGNLYVVGTTRSPNFPRRGAPSPAPVSQDAFIAKLDPAGALVYSVILGGRVDEVGTGIAVDAAGNAWVTGITSSPDFPRIDPLPPDLQGAGFDIFVAKLGSDGRLLFSTRFGGSRWDRPWGLALDPAGSAYVVGQTDSTDFPTTADAVQPGYGGGEDGFLVKLSPDGPAIEYSTYLGGNGLDHAWSVAVDADGEAHVAGYTRSADFPTFRAERGFLDGSTDGFLAKLTPSGESFVYSTYLGGSGSDVARAVTLSTLGHALVTGSQGGTTDSSVFVTELDRGGAIVFTARFGGSHLDSGSGIAVDPAGNIYVTGFTESPGFPLQAPLDARCEPSIGPFQGCFLDAFVTVLSPGGSDVLFSTFLGGSRIDGIDGSGIAVSASGAIHVAGETSSPDFPTFRAVQPAFGGVTDAFVTKIAFANQPPDCSAAAASPALLWPANGKLVPVRIGGVTDPDGDLIGISVTSIRQDEPLSKKGQPDATGLGTDRPMLRASRDGKGDGRVYHVSFEATDPAGAACSGVVTVCVPHDQRGRGCGDGGPLFGSTGQQP